MQSTHDTDIFKGKGNHLTAQLATTCNIRFSNISSFSIKVDFFKST